MENICFEGGEGSGRRSQRKGRARRKPVEWTESSEGIFEIVPALDISNLYALCLDAHYKSP